MPAIRELSRAVDRLSETIDRQIRDDRIRQEATALTESVATTQFAIAKYAADRYLGIFTQTIGRVLSSAIGEGGVSARTHIRNLGLLAGRSRLPLPVPPAGVFIDLNRINDYLDSDPFTHPRLQGATGRRRQGSLFSPRQVVESVRNFEGFQGARPLPFPGDGRPPGSGDSLQETTRAAEAQAEAQERTEASQSRLLRLSRESLQILKQRAREYERIERLEREAGDHALRNLGLANRRAQIERERASERDLVFQEAVQARQQAIGQDRGEQAAVRARHSIQSIQAEIEQQNERALESSRNTALNIRAFFSEMAEGVVQNFRSIGEGATEAFQSVQEQFQSLIDIEQRIQSGVERLQERQREGFERASRQTPEQQAIVDDFVSSTAVSNAESRYRAIYDSYNETAQLIERRDRRLSRVLASSLSSLVFDRERSFGQIATAFLRSSLRIILQSTFETNALIANNQRLITSNTQVAASRGFGLGGGLPGVGNLGGLNIGSIATGGAGALGVASLLFPQEFRNLFQEIGNTLSGAVEEVQNAGPNVGRIEFDDGTSRKVVSRSVQSQGGRSHFQSEP